MLVAHGRSFMSISVGLGSWSDAEYRGILYPPGTSPARRLGAYAQVFDRVEVNSAYYAIPQRSVVAGWARQTPAAFMFDLKLHRAFSQSPRKTAEDGELLGRLRRSVQPLLKTGKLGVFLLVLPPSFRPERHALHELDVLVEQLKPHRLAVELRHNDWVAGRQRAVTRGYFQERKLVWVNVDMPRIKESSIMPPVDEVTCPDLAYLRLHGRNRHWLEATSAAERHRYDYPPRELRDLARRIRKLAERAKHVHVVANNHARDFAPKTALALRQLLKKSR